MLQLTAAAFFFLACASLTLHAWLRRSEILCWSRNGPPPAMDGEVARFFKLVYLSLAVPFVVCFALFMPPFSVPDEFLHLRRAALVAQPLQFGPHHENGVVGATLPDWLTELVRCNTPDPTQRPHADAALLQRCSALEDQHASTFQALPNTAMYPAFFYLPQGIGLMLGHLTHAKPYSTYYFARLLNGLCAVALGWLALHTTRHLHAFMLAWLLLPLTLQQMGSLSLDATLLPAGFLFVAAFERVLLAKSVSAAAYVAWLTLWAALAATKPPLVTFFLLPLIASAGTRVQTWSGKRQALALGLAASFVLGWFAYVNALHIVLRTDLVADGMYHRYILRSEPWNFIAHVGKTLHIAGERYLFEAIGAMGRLETVLPRAALNAGKLALAAGALHALLQPWRPTWPIRAACASAVGASVILTFAVFYLTWTPAGAAEIEGIQGRYLLYLVAPIGTALVGLVPCRVARLPIAIVTVLASLAALAYVPWTMFVAHVIH